ncbi:MAG: DUF6807 family protein [Planctomycetota bacterium]|jgi:hypothetical protein
MDIGRRDFVRYGSAAALGLAVGLLPCERAGAIDYTKPVPEAKGLTAYLNGANALVRLNNMPLTGYRAHESLKYPYFCPVNGPVSGMSLTSESALPYPHHRGLWLGCEPMNGGDYWGDSSLERGQIRSVGLALGEVTKSSAEILDECQWVSKDSGSPMRDERKFVVTSVSDRLWCIDCDFRLSAAEDVEVKRAKHSFFAIRAAADISPPYGYGKQARWCGYHGKRRGHGDMVEGIAVMTHPDNPWPAIWFTREYGHLSPSPLNFQKKPWRLEKGQTLWLRYRVALHAGDPKEAALDRVYEQWVKG